MAENKANALKEANIKLKVYYSGETPADYGSKEIEVPLDAKNGKVWLVKSYIRNSSHASQAGGTCHQFVDAGVTYHSISRELSTLLDAVIVNSKQRESLSVLVDKILYETLMRDVAHEHDYVI